MWIRGEIAGIFYAWESGAKMLKVGKNGLFSVFGRGIMGIAKNA